MSVKGALSNNLLGKNIVPKPEYGNPEVLKDTNSSLWIGLKKNLAGNYIAEINAAYVEDGQVTVLATDPWGNSREFLLSHVNIKVD